MRNRFVALSCLTLLIVAALATIATTYNTQKDESTRSYIVQANDLDQARSLVASVGAEVTHELGIVNAVGVQLSVMQVDNLRKMSGVRRVYEDQGVAVDVVAPASCALNAEAELSFDDEEVYWTITNTGSSDVHLSTLMLLWPAKNDELEKIDFGDTTIFEGEIEGVSVSLNVHPYYRTDARLRIAAGSNKTLIFSFDDLKESQDSYEINVGTFEDCSVDFPRPPGVQWSGDSDVEAKRTYVASLVGADALHWQGVTGDGVGVAVVDTGIWAGAAPTNYLKYNAYDTERLVAQYDATEGIEVSPNANTDLSGHGTHVASILLSSRFKDSEFNGIAPNANLIVVKAFDHDGSGTYADVIRGLDWLIKTKDTHNIRVINLSFSTSPSSYYWDDPMNQAVMALWREGIVVVASAGNTGPLPMSIGAPGNVPYIITVGAMTDSVTPDDWTDDTLAWFSSTGPTVEAFIKPDIVAPGGHIRGLMDANHQVAKARPHFHDGDSYYTMSGTSQSTAVVSGAVALLLEAEPWLTPDLVKCKLISTARTATDANGAPVYSAFQQGAGMVDAEAAVAGNHYECANQSLDIDADIFGTAHFQGRARQNDAGEFYVPGMNGRVWDGNYEAGDGHVWGDGLIWNDGLIWGDGLIWNDGLIWGDGLIWNDGLIWGDGLIWNDGHTKPVSINDWVRQE